MPRGATLTSPALIANVHIGAPFHPAGSRPRAPCPVCSQEGDLYSVRGFHSGEYDSIIPANLLDTPPPILDSGKEMDAVRVSSVALHSIVPCLTHTSFNTWPLTRMQSKYTETTDALK